MTKQLPIVKYFVLFGATEGLYSTFEDGTPGRNCTRYSLRSKRSVLSNYTTDPKINRKNSLFLQTTWVCHMEPTDDYPNRAYTTIHGPPSQGNNLPKDPQSQSGCNNHIHQNVDGLPQRTSVLFPEFCKSQLIDFYILVLYT